MYESAPHLFKYFENSVQIFPDHTALICNEQSYTYEELNALVNRFANYLLSHNIRAGEYVCVFLDRSHINYICMLALFKIGAIYIPLDPKYPQERIKYILKDLNAKFLISKDILCPEVQIQNKIFIDEFDSIIRTQSTQIKSDPINYDDCYVIYTSGTTGHPKGVSISHKNICQYVSSASQVYDIQSSDKIYQGFSLSFDASMEEVWMAFAHGATLVACTSDDIRSGVGLSEFLFEHQITVMSTVPSLLAIIDNHLPDLRLIILGGEACHYQQVHPWFKPNRRIINSYGPTEATVICTIAELKPELNITIGNPLPGYEVIILNEKLQPLPHGEIGELCIGGEALSKGYINLPELTDLKFIQHPYHNNQKLYRSGDLAKINEHGQIEFLGRMDDQIKLRGFRIELNEIETKICQFPGVIQAVAQVIEEPAPTLVAFYQLDEKTKEVQPEAIIVFLQQSLPPFMIPNHLEQIQKFPLLPSGKVNKKALPKPNMQIFDETVIIPPKNINEQLLVDIYSEIFKRPISTHSHFFYDLGGHSLFAAQVISKLRKHPGCEHLSIKDIYQHPNIESFAKLLQLDNLENSQTNENTKPRHIPSNTTYFFTSVGQFLGAILSYSVHTWPFLLIWFYMMKHPSLNALQITYLVSFVLLYPALGAGLMVSMKWLLLGRIKPGQYRLWGWYHFRIWLFHCIEKNFIYLISFYGTPFINLYFKGMGAKIGKEVYIGNVSIKNFSLLYDLVEIGDESSIGLDSQICTQYIKNGYLHVGPIKIGKNCYVGNRALLKPNTVMHDHSYLDEMACLDEFTEVPSHVFYAGVPAQENPQAEQLTKLKSMEVVKKSIPKAIYLVISYLSMIGVSIVNGLSFLIAFLCILKCYQSYGTVLSITILAPIITLLGILAHYGIIKLCLSSTYSKFKKGNFSRISWIYLRYCWDMNLLLSTQIVILADTIFAQYIYRFFGVKIGKNCEIGGFYLSAIDMIELKEQSFIASKPSLAWPIMHHRNIHFDTLKLKKNSFVGNYSYVRQNEVIGKESLIGVSSISPDKHQAEKEQTGWLGIPPIFLPKRQTFHDIPESLTTKPSKSLVFQRVLLETIRVISPFYMLSLCLIAIYFTTIRIYQTNTLFKTLIYTSCIELLVFVSAVILIIGLKWLLMGKIKPIIKPLWSRYIWKYDIIEYLFVSFINPCFTNFFIGSTFFNFFLRLMGCKIGKKVYVGTLLISEFDLIQIGDHSAIDDLTLLQCHLFEDRIYKVSNLTIGDCCDVGISATILYDTVMENGSSLGDKSLLMKGESLPAQTSWQGSPAHFVSNQDLVPPKQINLADNNVNPPCKEHV